MYDHRKMMEERMKQCAEYIVKNKATIRQTAKKFGYTKTTVHKDLTERLPQYSVSLYHKVQEVINQNKSERHLRGGKATRERYRRKKRVN